MSDQPIRRKLVLRGDNSLTVDDLRRVLADPALPGTATVRTTSRIDREHDVTIWWDEDVPK